MQQQELIERKQYMQQLRSLKDQNVIKVISGVRRCGKSTLLMMFAEELIQSGVDRKLNLLLCLLGTTLRLIYFRYNSLNMTSLCCRNRQTYQNRRFWRILFTMEVYQNIINN